jgi:hypothetical protein
MELEDLEKKVLAMEEVVKHHHKALKHLTKLDGNDSRPLEKLVSLPSGFIEDFVTQRFHLKKGERVECSKDKLVEILNDFVSAIRARSN